MESHAICLGIHIASVWKPTKVLWVSMCVAWDATCNMWTPITLTWTTTCRTWTSRCLCGSPRLLMGFHICEWKATHKGGRPHVGLATHILRWASTLLHGDPHALTWKATHNYGHPYLQVGYHVLGWVSTKSCGQSRAKVGQPCGSHTFTAGKPRSHCGRPSPQFWLPIAFMGQLGRPFPLRVADHVAHWADVDARTLRACKRVGASGRAYIRVGAHVTRYTHVAGTQVWTCVLRDTHVMDIQAICWASTRNSTRARHGHPRTWHSKNPHSQRE